MILFPPGVQSALKATDEYIDFSHSNHYTFYKLNPADIVDCSRKCQQFLKKTEKWYEHIG
jgi:hypothetical protein